MGSIFNVTKEQIQNAIELYDVAESDIVSEEQAQQAYKLYIGLRKKPDFKKGHDKVKPIINNVVHPMSPELFKKPERIIYLTRWVVKILPYIEFLSTEAVKLPISRSGNDLDFETYLSKNLNQYLGKLEELMNLIPQTHNIIQHKDYDNIKGLIKKIINSVKEYYKGYPDRAFSELKIGLETHLKSSNYLGNVLTSGEENYYNTLYKMRIGSNHVYSSNEMFHIPFESRGLVKTNRYSIPGLPCVYLGSSSLTCWEELNKPDLNTVQTSLFLVKNISFLDMSIPPGAAIDRLKLLFIFNGLTYMKQTYKEILSYIAMWPLMAACSIRVKNAEHSFKPEYIVPQLLLQWIRQSDYDGICYFSTKINNYNMRNAGVYKNFAFPVQEQKKSGYCNILRNKFDLITDAVPWQLFQIYKGSYLAQPNEQGIQTEIEFVNGMKLLYSSTDFSRLEGFLNNKLP